MSDVTIPGGGIRRSCDARTKTDSEASLCATEQTVLYLVS